MTTNRKKRLRLIEIQESVLPEDEWLIGISVPDYFNGVGYSMPSLQNAIDIKEPSDSLLIGGKATSDLTASSNLDDPLKFTDALSDVSDALLSDIYKHREDALIASAGKQEEGLHIDPSYSSILTDSLAASLDDQNLYAFIPGLFYCSTQQTSVDAVLIEVIQNEKFGMTLSSFRPEDVRTLDVTKGFVRGQKGGKMSIQIDFKNLGTFHFQDFLRDTGISKKDVNYSQEIELARRISEQIPYGNLMKAYAASSFLRTRLVKLLDDIDFFGLNPRRRIYLRNRKHPYGTVIEVEYRGLDGVLDLGTESGISCPLEVDTEVQLNKLTFTKLMGSGIETNVEGAIMEMLHFIEIGLEGSTTQENVLDILSKEASS
ncbi:MAG: hypothetical protein JW779_06765 [Candidatus Thorarchaeota archaeon]|nr:hypothetical protein [Candidatus Thorarchaeota archaeon]